MLAVLEKDLAESIHYDAGREIPGVGIPIARRVWLEASQHARQVLLRTIVDSLVVELLDVSLIDAPRMGDHRTVFRRELGNRQPERLSLLTRVEHRVTGVDEPDLPLGLATPWQMDDVLAGFTEAIRIHEYEVQIGPLPGHVEDRAMDECDVEGLDPAVAAEHDRISWNPQLVA